MGYALDKIKSKKKRSIDHFFIIYNCNTIKPVKTHQILLKFAKNHCRNRQNYQNHQNYQNRQNPLKPIKTHQNPSKLVKTVKTVKTCQNPSKPVETHRNLSKLSKPIKTHRNPLKLSKWFLKSFDFYQNGIRVLPCNLNLIFITIHTILIKAA